MKKYIALITIFFMSVSLIPINTVSAYADENPNFLILVANSLYIEGDTSLTEALQLYVNDLSAEELNAEVLRISATDEGEGITNCETAQDLKALITEAYNNGCEGFVIIGSAPDIPTVYWEYATDTSDSNPTDLYYADMDETWVDRDADGIYDSYENEESADGSIIYTPEMYYGRINPNGYVTSDSEQVEKIVDYLNRVHEYRVNGGNLPEEIQNRALVFNDYKDFRTSKEPANWYSEVFEEVYGMFDEAETNATNLMEKLDEGYAFISLAIHSSYDFHQVYTNSNKYYENYNLYIDEINENVTPKFNFMNLYCCSACKYEQSGEAINNLGEYYLFGNDYALNITGSTGSWGPWLKESFYNTLFDNCSVGEAFKNFLLCNSSDGQVKAVLLGDPTLTYNVNELDNETPYITANLAGEKDETNATAKVGRYFKVAKTNYTEGVYYDIEGLPSNELYEIDDAIYWIPEEPEVGNTYDCVVTSYNEDSDGNRINKYEESFRVTVTENIDGSSYEAEEYRTDTIFKGSGCSGGERVGWVGETKPLTFTEIYVPESGYYKVLIDYISGEDRTGTIVTSGADGDQDAVDLTFENQGDWETVGTTEAEVYLSAGSNSITISKPGGWTADIDRIFVVENVDGELYEAESTVNEIGGYITNKEFCSGRKLVTFVGKDKPLTFVGVSVDEAGDYTMQINYVSGADREGVVVTSGSDGEYSQDVSFDGLTWSEVGTKEITVHLSQGFNYIEFTTNSGYMPDIDSIIIE